MANILLLHPRTGSRLQTHRWQTGHLGLAWIAACLLQRGHSVRVLDAKNQPITDDDFRRHVVEFQPDIFGVTAMTHEIHAAAHACRVVKEAGPNVLTIVGGPHTSALPERTLEEFASVDIAAVGEGEATMCELAAALKTAPPEAVLGEIRGIAFRLRDRIHRTPNRPWLEHLDELPFPAWHLFPRVYWPSFASRGCPFGCVFCQRVMGRRLRLRSVDNVLAELDALEQQVGQRTSWFQDDTFGVRRQWLEEFIAKMMARNQRLGYVWTWGGNTRANLADPSLYRRMKEAGCTAVSFGIESGNDLILRLLGKAITSSMALEAIASAKRAGLRTSAFFILGHPGETLKTALQTVHLAATCGADSIAVGVMVPYPGTEVWDMARAGQYGYRLLSEDWRVYDKYFGNALAVRGLSHRFLEALQVLTYIWYYIYNLRLRDLARFFLRFRSEAWAMLKRLLRGKAS